MKLSSVYYDPFLAAAAAQAQQDPNYRLQVCLNNIFVMFLFQGARCATNKCKFYTHFHIYASQNQTQYFYTQFIY